MMRLNKSRLPVGSFVIGVGVSMASEVSLALGKWSELMYLTTLHNIVEVHLTLDLMAYEAMDLGFNRQKLRSGHIRT